MFWFIGFGRIKHLHWILFLLLSRFSLAVVLALSSGSQAGFILEELLVCTVTWTPVFTQDPNGIGLGKGSVLVFLKIFCCCNVQLRLRSTGLEKGEKPQDFSDQHRNAKFYTMSAELSMTVQPDLCFRATSLLHPELGILALWYWWLEAHLLIG